MCARCQLKLTMGTSHSKNPENNKIDLKLQTMSLLDENKNKNDGKKKSVLIFGQKSAKYPKQGEEKDSQFNTYIFPDKNRNYPSDLEDDPDVEKTRLKKSISETDFVIDCKK